MKHKICTCCGVEYPADREFFYKEKRTKDGLKAKCKKCHNKESYLCAKGRKRDQKAYIEKNKDRLKQSWKEYRERNKDKVKKRKQLYYLNNKEKITKSVREYQLKNKDKILLRQSIYKRIRYTDETRNYSLADWENCKAYFNSKCAYCGKRVKLTKDHFFPFKYGGEYSTNNIVPACKSCNCSKYDNNFFEWYPLQKFYSIEREQKILKYLKYEANQTQQLSIL